MGRVGEQPAREVLPADALRRAPAGARAAELAAPRRRPSSACWRPRSHGAPRASSGSGCSRCAASGRLESELDDGAAPAPRARDREERPGRHERPPRRERAARISLGGVDQIKEELRDASGASTLEGVRQDVRYGLRSIRQNPAFAAAVVLTLGLGIGANTAIFSVVNGVLLRPLPYGEPERLVVVRQSLTLARDAEPRLLREGAPRLPRREPHARGPGRVPHDVVHSARRPRGRARPDGVVSAGFFDFLGVTPLLGRTFRAEDDAPGADAVLVLSYEYWKRRHGGDPSVVGRGVPDEQPAAHRRRRAAERCRSSRTRTTSTCRARRARSARARRRARTAAPAC